VGARADRLALVRRLYGFDFPADLAEFWTFACRLRPLEPLRALEDIGITLVGPFEVLEGRFDGRTPLLSQLLHWRYHSDPPEFFTVLYGSSGLHWGYYLDEPRTGEGCVASYYAADALEIAPEGDTLFEAVRLHLEMQYRDCREDESVGLAHAEEARALDRLRQRLLAMATGDRPETGQDYEELYPACSRRTTRVVAATRDGMGIVVPEGAYRPLSLRDKQLWTRLRGEDDPAEIVGEARRDLSAGYPGTALKLGKDLWAIGGGQRTGYAYELLDAAYAALDRSILQEVLRVHRANRDLPSVDILENEAECDGP
jgi:hypothetical protein